jgi:hypothetical protein
MLGVAGPGERRDGDQLYNSDRGPHQSITNRKARSLWVGSVGGKEEGRMQKNSTTFILGRGKFSAKLGNARATRQHDVVTTRGKYNYSDKYSRGQ